MGDDLYYGGQSLLRAILSWADLYYERQSLLWGDESAIQEKSPPRALNAKSE